MADNRELALVLKLVADQFQSELKKSQGLLGDFNSFIKSWQVQLTAAGSALFAVAKSTANYGDELVKTSQRMGVTVEETARLQHAANLSDTDLKGLTSTVAKLSKNMLEASMGSAEARETFYRLGINVTQSNGQLKGTSAVLLELSDRFRVMPDGPEKTALAMKAFGKSATEILPLLNSNLREAFDEAEKLGLVMSETDARAAEHFNDELTKLQGAIKGVTNDIGSALIPKFDAMAHALTTIITDARQAAEAITGLNKLGQPSVGTVAPAGGGANLKIMPQPPKSVLEQFQPERYFPAEKTLQQLQEDYRLYITGLTAMGTEKLAKQESLGKALLEIYLAQNRAIEIQNKNVREESNEYLLMLQRAEQLQAIDEQEQERKGKLIVDQTKVEVQVRDNARQREQQGLVENQQAWVSYFEKLGGSAEGLYDVKMGLLRAQLAQELNLNLEQAGRLLIAWQNYDKQLSDSILANTEKTLQEKETLELRYTEQAKLNKRELGGDPLEGMMQGFRDFTRDTGPFGMMQNAARQTAQAMQSSFQSLFFDAMNGKIKSLQDLFTSAFNFIKQIVANILSQLATNAIISRLPSGLSGMFGGSGGGGATIANDIKWVNAGGLIERKGFAAGGLVPQRFAFGGPVYSNNDSVPALLTPGEFVVSRKGVDALQRINQGDIWAPSRNSERQVYVTMNVSATDAGSFRKSQGQMMGDLAAMMRLATRNL